MEKKLFIQNNKGFTLVEIIVSLLLLSIFILLLASIVTMTSLTSQKFLNYTDYEYAMMHKKIFQLYEDSRKVTATKNNIIFQNDKENREHKVVFNSRKIFKQTRNPGENFASGYSLLLDNIQSYNLEKKEENLIIRIVDRGGKTRTIKLFLKDQIKLDEEKEELLLKEKEESEKIRLEDEKILKTYEEERNKLLEEYKKYKEIRTKELENLLEIERGLILEKENSKDNKEKQQ
ncbi:MULTISPECIES: prepilin-type N-terminal cleavage/methylation domain-containing protein [unclassified Gemella]|uniref:prepilin-type N-terminal cleavage/methylation domain-containing protein n=1 Tax=unclassified Gemella TaxID=2624949 RepID=UPI0010741693|nr:prepilin-type N-terminal cleavage/methylation domain-containing protein [Gemella sp. GL1.1]MBF0747144.1 prepilin-type N-terminal cleavage/methylation domain-containing protein [Gemella sp. 19428wG2_WT2a]NYS27112.1 prepilin-type N-terminal cleavage/methylation domain-containing protein [Gemella sp. GL1]TFU58384.1 prepilin-type N-terminal cleavage/methylation domain-containing protein [Gemella sp. WT2a]